MNSLRCKQTFRAYLMWAKACKDGDRETYANYLVSARENWNKYITLREFELYLSPDRCDEEEVTALMEAA